ncbi:mitochondrial pyruvate dehydrogenase E1 component beta subunit [Pisolithus marmoratus]|nr:mitochondrial pyruvate dehydrogenase E1 component beta subunit [Pisolithus marmoratus]
MASLARIRPCLTRRIPMLMRGIQTSADTTQLQDTITDHSQPFTVKLHEDSFRTYKIDPPSLEVQVQKDELLKMYKDMQCMRRMEMAADALYKAKLIRGFCHLAIGQEAVSVGLEYGITPEDRVITAYRCHPFAVMRGGTSQRRTQATFALVQVFEAFNMAKLWDLPCVFVCENNKYAPPIPSTSREGDKIPGIQVNGMDIIASRHAVQFARNWVIEGNGPLLMEFVTYRYGGHSMSDPGTTYRTREEVQRMRSTQDPIRGLQRYIEEWGLATEQELKARTSPCLTTRTKKAKAEIDQAVEEAKKSPTPRSEDLWTDIYYKGTEPPFMRGREREEVHYY